MAGRAALPLDRARLVEPLPACAPLRLALIWALEGAFELQRAPLAGREPFAVCAPEGRAVVGRASELARRAGRVLGRLPVDDCAGLRSREWVAGRLKWGRAAADLMLEAGLRAAGGRDWWASAELREAIEIGEIGEIGEADAASFGTSSSCASSSWSRERRKYAEAGMEELV